MQDIKIVIGGNFGDEGKGLMTDYFTKEARTNGRSALVVCSNGGAQRGHTVTTSSGIRHVFHHFGSGTFEGADTWLPRFFIVNPMLFMNEYEGLQEKGVSFDKIKIYMDPECPVTTPFDMIANQVIEEHRGRSRHGSCGMGIWETILRDGKLLGEMSLMTDAELKDYLAGSCKNRMASRFEQLGISEIPENWRDIIEDEGLVRNYIADFRQMCRLSGLRGVSVMKEYDTIIFEAGQGLLLDRCRKEFGCHTTPSNTGFRNPAELIREYYHYLFSRGMTSADETSRNIVTGSNTEWNMADGDDVRNTASVCETGRNISNITEEDKLQVEVCYVTRTYLTRHGAGPFPEECSKDEINPTMVDMTNVPNPHQGTLRYGKLDAKDFIRRIVNDFDSDRLPERFETKRTVAVTHVNEYSSPVIKEADYISDGEKNITVHVQ
ncbi:MAG: adenylosuccinate synthetase [Eubacterium sp.]|nr:adenylosuccinate synthetase [Eubacterium sp.]